MFRRETSLVPDRPTQSSRSRWLRRSLKLSLWGMWLWACAQPPNWVSPEQVDSSCDPAPRYQDDPRWKSSFGSASGKAYGCLQVAWGEKASDLKEHINVPIQVDKSGAMNGLDKDQKAQDIKLPLPAKARRQQRRFRVYVLSLDAASYSYESHVEKCQELKPNYSRCFEEGNEEKCWFYFEFHPQGTGFEGSFVPLPYTRVGKQWCQLLSQPPPPQPPNPGPVKQPVCSAPAGTGCTCQPQGEGARFKLPASLGNGPVHYVAYSPRGQYLAASSNPRSVAIRRLSQGRWLSTDEPLSAAGQPRKLRFGLDDDRLFALGGGAQGAALHSWLTTTGARQTIVETGVQDYSLHPKIPQRVAVAVGGEVRIFDIPKSSKGNPDPKVEKLLHKLSLEADVAAVRYHPGGGFLAVRTAKEILLWKPTKAESKKEDATPVPDGSTLDGVREAVLHFAFNRNGSRLAALVVTSRGQQNNVFEWEVSAQGEASSKTNRLVLKQTPQSFQMASHPGHLEILALATEGQKQLRFLMPQGSDWPPLQDGETEPKDLYSVAWHPNGRELTAGLNDGFLRTWKCPDP